jgi:hypothetical protein
VRLLFAAIAAVAIAVVAEDIDAQTVKVVIDATKTLGPINPLLYGINTARWDESLFPGPTDAMLRTCDRDAIEKVSRSGITLLKYPGGNDADSYIWNSPDNSQSEMDTEEYIAFCREVGAQPFITVNFNAAPELAAAWVRFCNRERGYNVMYWEVGDEQWGTWAKGHAPPEEYAKKYVSFVKAMKGVDPSIKVATNVPLGVHPENWTERVLKAAAPFIDMLTFTIFPQKWGEENDDTLFATTRQFRSLVVEMKKEVIRVLGKQRADSILYVNVGYNSVNHSPGPQTLQIVNALWTADMLGTMAEVGVDIGCYWALHNYYPPRNGDYGYLSSDGSNTPRYPYFVFQMLSHRLVGSAVHPSTSDPALSVYAAKHDKVISIVAINKDKSSNKPIEIRLDKFDARRSASVWVLDENRKNERMPDIQAVNGRFTVNIPRYSMVVVDCIGTDSALPMTNLALTAECSASSVSTIGPNFKPQNAADGKLYTKWNSAAWTNSNGLEAQWFRLAWDIPIQFDLLKIVWGATYAVDYTIDFSSDGATWTTVRTVKNGRGGTETIEIPRVTARQLRLSGQTGSKGISAYSIREIEVYSRR